MRGTVLLLLAAGCDQVFGLQPVTLPDAYVCPTPQACAGGTHDEDQDCIPDACDLCPERATDATDADGDGIGDACDPRPTTSGDLVRFEGFGTPLDGRWSMPAGTFTVANDAVRHTSAGTHEFPILLWDDQSLDVIGSTSLTVPQLEEGAEHGIFVHVLDTPPCPLDDHCTGYQGEVAYHLGQARLRIVRVNLPKIVADQPIDLVPGEPYTLQFSAVRRELVLDLVDPHGMRSEVTYTVTATDPWTSGHSGLYSLGPAAAFAWFKLVQIP